MLNQYNAIPLVGLFLFLLNRSLNEGPLEKDVNFEDSSAQEKLTNVQHAIDKHEPWRQWEEGVLV